MLMYAKMAKRPSQQNPKNIKMYFSCEHTAMSRMKKRPEAAGIITILVTVIRCLAVSGEFVSGYSGLFRKFGGTEIITCESYYGSEENY
jgi:hypothetical protein